MKQLIFKSSMFRMIAALCVLSLTALTSTSAPNPNVERMIVSIPFEFSVSGKRLPAGDYTVKRDSSMGGAYIIQSRDGKTGVITLTSGRLEARGTQAAAKLVFNNYRHQYFLSQIWTGDVGKQVPQSRAERALKQELASVTTDDAQPRQITLLAR